MTETIELRDNPELKLILTSGSFDIVDAFEPTNTGSYEFRQLKGVELNSERTNWYVSILSWFTELFVGSANGGIGKSG